MRLIFSLERTFILLLKVGFAKKQKVKYLHVNLEEERTQSRNFLLPFLLCIKEGEDSVFKESRTKMFNVTSLIIIRYLIKCIKITNNLTPFFCVVIERKSCVLLRKAKQRLFIYVTCLSIMIVCGMTSEWINQ